MNQIGKDVFMEFNKYFDTLEDGTIALPLTEYLFLDILEDKFMVITIFMQGGCPNISPKYLITEERIKALNDLQDILKWK